MDKANVITQLRELGDILEVAAANEFEVLAYRNAAQSLESWNGNLEKAVAAGELTSIPAVGKGLAALISELVQTGDAADARKVRELVPAGLPVLLRFRGLGPKRVRTLWQSLDIVDTKTLQSALDDGRVAALKGFGPKLIERMREGLAASAGAVAPPKASRRQAPSAVSRRAPTTLATGTLRVGVSGYSYAGWKGNFYPDDAKSDQFLAYYATQLPTVEINNTFYRFPSPKVVEGWTQAVQGDFRFSIKAHRRISHTTRLGKAGWDTLTDLVERLRPLGSHLACLLIQLPPPFARDDAKLLEFLQHLPHGPRYAIEFRHESWNDDAVRTHLASANVAQVAHQRHGVPETHVTADFVYARLPVDVGPHADHWASWFTEQSRNGRDVLAYHKHDETGILPRQLASTSVATSRKQAPSQRPSASKKQA